MYLWMYGKMDCPPLGRARLFLVTEEFIVGTAEVVAGDAAADGPASGAVHVVLDDKLLGIATFLATARYVALHSTTLDQ